ncbi:MAG: copper chaperone PCu(A)C, partial [Granulosicoccaceae bacterium]
AGGMAELKPGGYHIMMLGIHKQLRDGEQVEIEVEFANGDKMSFTSPIKKMMGMKMKHGEMDHSKMKH